MIVTAFFFLSPDPMLSIPVRVDFSSSSCFLIDNNAAWILSRNWKEAEGTFELSLIPPLALDAPINPEPYN